MDLKLKEFDPGLCKCKEHSQGIQGIYIGTEGGDKKLYCFTCLQENPLVKCEKVEDVISSKGIKALYRQVSKPIKTSLKEFTNSVNMISKSYIEQHFERIKKHVNESLDRICSLMKGRTTILFDGFVDKFNCKKITQQLCDIVNNFANENELPDGPELEEYLKLFLWTKRMPTSLEKFRGFLQTRLVDLEKEIEKLNVSLDTALEKYETTGFQDFYKETEKTAGIYLARVQEDEVLSARSISYSPWVMGKKEDKSSIVIDELSYEPALEEWKRDIAVFKPKIMTIMLSKKQKLPLAFTELAIEIGKMEKLSKLTLNIEGECFDDSANIPCVEDYQELSKNISKIQQVDEFCISFQTIEKPKADWMRYFLTNIGKINKIQLLETSFYNSRTEAVHAILQDLRTGLKNIGQFALSFDKVLQDCSLKDLKLLAEAASNVEKLTEISLLLDSPISTNDKSISAFLEGIENLKLKRLALNFASCASVKDESLYSLSTYLEKNRTTLGYFFLSMTMQGDSDFLGSYLPISDNGVYSLNLALEGMQNLKGLTIILEGPDSENYKVTSKTAEMLKNTVTGLKSLQRFKYRCKKFFNISK